MIKSIHAAYSSSPQIPKDGEQRRDKIWAAASRGPH